MYINKAMIFGNLTRDPELRSLPSGVQVCSFGVATNRVYKDKNGVRQEAADFHNVVVFAKTAELVSKYLHKGSSVFVEGRMQTRSWDDKTSGEKKYRTEIVGERVQFGPKGSGNAAAFGGTNSDAPKVGKEVNGKKSDKDDKGEAIEYPAEEINAEDIPF
jgi:single-strand DNA-binding protein